MRLGMFSVPIPLAILHPPMPQRQPAQARGHEECREHNTHHPDHGVARGEAEQPHDKGGDADAGGVAGLGA